MSPGTRHMTEAICKGGNHITEAHKHTYSARSTVALNFGLNYLAILSFKLLCRFYPLKTSITLNREFIPVNVQAYFTETATADPITMGARLALASHDACKVSPEGTPYQQHELGAKSIWQSWCLAGNMSLPHGP